MSTLVFRGDYPSTLNGNDVYNPRGEKLGSIKELMLDIDNGKVCYAVLSFGGFLSLGEKLFAVPWRWPLLCSMCCCWRPGR